MRAIMLGLGASGTSYYAALADRMGWITPQPHKGHMPFPTHETKRGREINERMVSEYGHHVYDTEAFVPLAPDAIASEAQMFVADMDDEHDRWLFKDPRSTLTFGAIWQQFSWDKIICVYRHPGDTTASLKKHHVRGPLAEESSLRTLWTQWSQLMLCLPDAEFIRFPGDEARLAVILGCELPADTGFRPGLNHGSSAAIPDWASAAWDAMETCRAN